MPGKVEELKKELNKPEEEEKEEKEEEEEGEEEGVVKIDGEKFKEDPENPGEALLDEKGDPVPFEEKKEEEKGEFVMPDKFKGKSPEEIAKSYTELEKMIEGKAKEKAEEMVEKLKKEGKLGEIKKEEGEEEKEEDEEKPDFRALTPEGFAKWVDKRIEKRARKLAAEEASRVTKEVMDQSTKVRTEVQKEIKDAQKDHPLLKTSGEYRELVVAIIESKSSRGESISLKEACEAVEKVIGKTKEIGEVEKEKMKKIKAQVETEAPVVPGAGKETEGDRIRRTLLEGQKGSPLGGLGI